MKTYFNMIPNVFYSNPLKKKFFIWVNFNHVLESKFLKLFWYGDGLSINLCISIYMVAHAVYFLQM